MQCYPVKKKKYEMYVKHNDNNHVNDQTYQLRVQDNKQQLIYLTHTIIL